MRFRPSNVARSHRANHWSSSSTCAIADRFAACKLVLHPQKTKIVYCKDVNRHGDFPDIHFDFLGFQFRARKTMWVKADRRIFAHSFQPAASPKALTRISRDIRSWALHHRSDKGTSNNSGSFVEFAGATLRRPFLLLIWRGCASFYGSGALLRALWTHYSFRLRRAAPASQVGGCCRRGFADRSWPSPA